jgi:DNA-binding NarL/FixJ family response regulator
VIVDDHASFRCVARALLDQRGFAVVGEANGGAAACELVARVAPDAVLLDVGLGAECGFDVARTLVAAHPGLAVLLVSAREDVASVLRVQVSGACGFVPKSRLADADLAALWRLA